MKSITEQIQEMQEENKALGEFRKLFDKACQISFGKSEKEIQKMIESKSKVSKFEDTLSNFFGLKTDKDKETFIHIMCTETTLNYYTKKLDEKSAE